jgi:hypothetical protein
MSEAKLINHTSKSVDELYQVIWKKFKLNSLIVIERSSGKVDIVQEIILKRNGDIIFKFDDEQYSSSFFAIEIGITKQVHFEW